MIFTDFKSAVNKQFDYMVGLGKLFTTDVGKDVMWETYLSSFPEGTNPIYKERTEHDCQCCKQFIRACGNVVAIDSELKVHTIWDIDIEGHYQVVADAMANLIRKKKITNIFLHYQKNIGTNYNLQEQEDGNVIKWEHFHYKLPLEFVDKDPGTVLSNTRASKDVFLRGLNEITNDSVNTVLELIDQNSIYRGEEHKNAVKSFQKLLKNYINLLESGSDNLDNFAWINADKPGARIKNTAIGTLLLDISEEMELDKAVKQFEAKVAPENYKRPTAVVTSGMIKKAQKKIEELGFTDSLPRRNAVMDDLTINNVLFANRDTKKAMNVFDEMADEVGVKVKDLKKIEEVDIDLFIESILPKAKSVDVLLENRHENNLMSLVAPVNANAPGMFKWNNNFSWAYNGDVTDSIKERVKTAGGIINADLRFSLAWYNYDDLDIHVEEPNGHIYYGAKRSIGTGGRLDVDMNANEGRSRTPVENVVWPILSKMKEGEYTVFIRQFRKRETKDFGFVVEMEYKGKIKTFHYSKPMRNKEDVKVLRFRFTKKDGIEIIESLKSEESSKELWNLKTQQFQKVSMIMNSPNHWDGHKTGNKHYFFILDGCQSGEPARGFFNEFLNEGLTEHRKVFEILGSKMKTEPSDQLSGIGFSSTKRNSVICKVTGSFSRVVKVNF
jgi:hypothetical protein